jgi:hypothetical protein
VSGSGFWLVIDRELLQPVQNFPLNVPHMTYEQCPHDDGWGAPVPCGAVFNLDSLGDHGNSLAQTLVSISPRNLICLVTKGCPSAMASSSESALGNAVKALGAPSFSLSPLNTNLSHQSFHEL